MAALLFNIFGQPMYLGASAEPFQSLLHRHGRKKRKRNHKSRQPRRKWASALQGARAEGQRRATTTGAAATEAAPSMVGQLLLFVGADTLKIDRTILKCFMYWGAIAHLWHQGPPGMVHPQQKRQHAYSLEAQVSVMLRYLRCSGI